MLLPLCALCLPGSASPHPASPASLPRPQRQPANTHGSPAPRYPKRLNNAPEPLAEAESAQPRDRCGLRWRLRGAKQPRTGSPQTLGPPARPSRGASKRPWQAVYGAPKRGLVAGGSAELLPWEQLRGHRRRGRCRADPHPQPEEGLEARCTFSSRYSAGHPEGARTKYWELSSVWVT